MAPHKFWLKRQISIDLPDLPDLPLPGPPDTESTSATPTGTSTQPTNTEDSTTGRTSATPTPSVTPPPSTRPTPTSSQATPSPSLPVQDEPEEEEDNDVVLIESSGPVVRPTNTEDTLVIVDLPASTVIQSRTITTDVTSSAVPSNVGGAAKGSNTFLENKVLSGIVFGICGLVGLLLILGLIFFINRKARRNRKLEQEIISWDPDHVQTFGNSNGGPDTNGALAAGRVKDDDGWSIDSLDEKSKTSGSLEGHYTYALPSTTYKGNPNAAIPPAPYFNYGHPQPVHVALPTYGAQQQQPYRSW